VAHAGVLQRNITLTDTVGRLPGHQIDPDPLCIQTTSHTETRLEFQAQPRSLVAGNFSDREVVDHVLTTKADQLQVADFTQNELHGRRILRVVGVNSHD
jgi:hypothetical protein